MHTPWHCPPFAPELEGDYLAAAAPAARRILRAWLVLSAGLALIMVWAAMLSSPLAFRRAMMLQAGVNLPAALMAAWRIGRSSSQGVREALFGAAAIVCVVCTTVQSHWVAMQYSNRYVMAGGLTIFSAGLLAPLRLRQAAAFAACALAAYAAALLAPADASSRENWDLLVFTALLVPLSLRVRSRIECEERRGYLLRVQDRLHRREQALAQEHAAAAEAERLRSGLMTERAQALENLAHAFDAQVRTMVTAVAQTAQQIRAQATALLSTASSTELSADGAATLATAASADTTLMAQAAMQLRDSVEQVCKQSQATTEVAERMSSQVSRSDSALTALNSAADQVGAAVTLIGGIAGRTKLVALNARIEAARVGKEGQGFAVVAEEVKLLAKQTAATTIEVGKLVNGMRDAHAGVAAALSSITRNIGQVAAFASHVDHAVEMQAATIGAIAETAAALHDKAGRVSTKAHEVANSAETTNTAAREMLQAADLLAEEAGILQRKASAFIKDVHVA